MHHRNINSGRAAVLILIMLATVAFIFLLNDQMTFQGALNSAKQMKANLASNPSQTIVIFVLIYLIANALPLPFLSVPTVIAGYLFGTFDGLIIVSFASASGSCLLFTSSRYLFQDWVQKKTESGHPAIKQASLTNSFWLATSVRFLPGIPFSIPTIALSLSKLSLVKFYFSTQVGMLTILFIYVNAGSSLATIESIDGVLNARLLSSLILIAIVPAIYAAVVTLNSARTKQN